ncbi:MAG TPA: hypothetical protein VME43_28745 [Bryobacteraceae bacterium]|nr:hypothetical protein [Bryobacteraceae bacterium]
MGLLEDMIRAQRRLAGPNRPGATVHATTPSLTITSETTATVPSNQARTKIGVGESVTLTVAGGTGTPTWAMSPSQGTLVPTSGASVTYTAPDRANTVTITATAGGSATITFTIVEPSDVSMHRRPNTLGHHTINHASTGLVADVFILPADVSFENCSVQESDVNAVGSGCFQAYYASHPTGHQPNASPSSVGPPDNDTSGSRVSIPDLLDCSSSKCAGGWSWTIPWSFQVGSGAQKQFTSVVQQITITAAGDATISKAGATNTTAYGAASEADPLFSSP